MHYQRRLHACVLPAAALVAATAAEARAQRRVTGVVTGEGGAPLAGASVQVLGATAGASTNDEGRFALTTPAGAQTLRVRRIGYKARQVGLAAAQGEVAVALERDVLQLEAQVVTGTATTVSTANAANAVAVVRAEQLARVPAPTLDNALQGKIAGAVITQNSGAPGGGVQVQIRGVTSLNASSSPLYVVDGVIVNNSAVANGLNAITQASGGNGPSAQDQQVNRVADLNPNDVESVEVLKGASAGAIYGSKGSNGVVVITTKRGRGGRPAAAFTQRVGTARLANRLGLRCFTEAEAVRLFEIDPADYGGCHDFERELFGRSDLSYESVASVSGGSGGTTYFVSGLAKHDAGIEANTGYNKHALRANVGQQVGPRLSLQATTEILHSLTERNVSGNDNGGYSPYTVLAVTPTFFDFRPSGGRYPRNPYVASENNVLQSAALTRTPEDNYRVIGGATIRWSVLDRPRQTLDLVATGGVDHYALSSKLVSPPEIHYEDKDGYPGTIVNNQANSTNANLSATLAHRYARGSAFTATTSAGLRREQFQVQTLYTTGRNVPSGQTVVNYGIVQQTGEALQLVRDLSYFAQEEFLALNERLLLTAAVNAERSTVNGDPRKFYAYPKVSASYRLPVLPRFTDQIKLRLAYGRAGNKPPSESQYSNLVVTFNDNVIGERPSRTLGNPGIRPETSSETEGGVDAIFLGGRAKLELTRFRKQVDDLILFPRLAPSTGYGSSTVNGGRLVNRGTEVGLDVEPLRLRNFGWTSRATYASVRGTVTRLDIPSYLYGIGFGAAYGDVRIEQGYSPTQVIATVGGAERKLGDALPDYTAGFANDFTAGPFRLSTLLDWRKGGKLVNLTNAYFDGFFADGSGLLADTRASVRRIGATTYAPYVEDGTFVKLRELTLGYTLPRRASARVLGTRAGDLRLEASGRNLVTWTRYTGLDPEVSNFSNVNVGRIVDVTPFPPSRTFFLTVAATF